tara:strand:+ start:1207 stop:2013 length:807 start_codon:yes stop_codon:yes gene_type:complete
MIITIIGCGWLGRPLGAQLTEVGHSVFGSTRNESFFEEISSFGIQPFLLDSYGSMDVPSEVTDSTELLIIALPPISRNKGVSGIQEDHDFMKKILKQFDNSVRIIFTSSTSVYPKREREYYESYTFSDKDKQTLSYQRELAIETSGKSSVILRLGGLIGPKRHPITSLKGRENMPNPEGPINFVHQKDVLGVIRKVVSDSTISGVFNVVNPMHPSRESYYRSAAKHYGLVAPKFLNSSSVHRIISSQKLIQEHNFKYTAPLFIFPDLD